VIRPAVSLLLTASLLVPGPADPPRAPVPLGLRWSWPVAAPHPIARPYAAPANPYGPGHRGIDIAAPAGTTVRAPADGIVHFAGFVVDRPLLSIEQAGGVLSSFEPVRALVATGDPVARGQVIAVLLAGHCPAVCLHVGARVAGQYVNPLLFLGEVPRAVLLPVG
jgi:murein DD-endopeptidase MepM/ murein hydrolase activator NlpD